MSILPTEIAFENWRNETLRLMGGVKGVGKFPWEVLERVELFPGASLDACEIVVPERYLAPGPRRRKSFRTRKPGLDGLLAKGATEAATRKREEWVRRALLALWLPHNLTVKKQGYSASTWLSKSKLLLAWLKFVIHQLAADEHDIWPLLLEHSRNGFSEHTKSAVSAADLQRTVQIFLDAAMHGILPAPPKGALPKSYRTYSYRSGHQPSEPATRLQKASRRAFPDEFVARVIFISIWLHENLAAQAIDCWEVTEAINNADAYTREKISEAAKAERLNVVTSYDWRDKNGHKIVQLPFELLQHNGKTYTPTDTWPPTTYSTLPLLINVMQGLNASTTAFCSAARIHEVSGANRPSPSTKRDGVLRSTTYKFSGSLGGEKRNWPLHPFAQQALELQERLASVVRPRDADYLWVQTRHSSTGKRGDPLLDISSACVEAYKNLNLTDLAAGRPHYHRWRHSTARLIGLTVENAVQVIQDIFGHEDVEMALHYMLSDPEIVEWSLQIAKDVAIVLAEEAIEEIETGTAGGVATGRISASLVDYKMRRGIEALGTDDIREAAEFLTLNGTAFQRVRRGVLCTKGLGEHGKCTKSRGRPDPGACHTDCIHRLELALEQSQCRDGLKYLIECFDQAQAASDHMKIANLKGQIVAELKRWPPVREEILLQSDTARQIWNEARGER